MILALSLKFQGLEVSALWWKGLVDCLWASLSLREQARNQMSNPNPKSQSYVTQGVCWFIGSFYLGGGAGSESIPIALRIVWVALPVLVEYGSFTFFFDRECTRPGSRVQGLVLAECVAFLNVFFGNDHAHLGS